MIFKRLLSVFALLFVMQATDMCQSQKIDPNTGYYPGQTDSRGYFVVTRTPYPTMPENWGAQLTPEPYEPNRDNPNYVGR